jgi:hypothetical protein
MPEANETVRLADGDVMVAILRIPSACALHRFTLFLLSRIVRRGRAARRDVGPVIFS